MGKGNEESINGKLEVNIYSTVERFGYFYENLINQMNLVQKFQFQWQQQFSHLSANNCELLLAVSGGVDSVVLVDLVAASGFSFQIAHCNFQLRGEESERDEELVIALAAKYGKEIHCKRFETLQYSAENKISIQVAARDLRYQWFNEIMNSWNQSTKKLTSADTMNNLSNYFVVTAHHADDNIETLLMHFFRGTGIHGLEGIQPELKQRKLLRPLLPFRKNELLSYADSHGLKFVEDSSNNTDKYTRNFFRNNLLPQIAEVFPKVEENLIDNITRFHEIAQLYQKSVDVEISKLIEYKDNECRVPVLKWKKSSPLHTITWELIKKFGFHSTQTEEVIKLLEADNGSYQSSHTHRIIRNRNWLLICPISTEVAQNIIINENEKKVFFENGSISISNFENQPIEISSLSIDASLSSSGISFPLLLRKWKAGDYFYPLGMVKKKKVSKFLIDLKLSKTEKEKVWVIESNQKIIWVVGYRIDNRFKITTQTKGSIMLSYRK